jgi:hypothetical protein
MAIRRITDVLSSMAALVDIATPLITATQAAMHKGHFGSKIKARLDTVNKPPSKIALYFLQLQSDFILLPN